MTDFITRAELISLGFTPRSLTAAVRAGSLIRARRDHYLPAGTADEIVRAVRVGGRLTCVSLLAMIGVFVQRLDRLHVHVSVNAGRLRSPHDRRRTIEDRSRRGVRVHWTSLSRHPGNSTFVSLVDALVHAVVCQAPRAAIATLDSAVRMGVVLSSDLDEVFDILPRRYGVLRMMMDPRTESGTETLVGLMLRGLGCSYEAQVRFRGVGRVDFLVEGWLVIECDSEAHHGTWADHERDRRRDSLLASRGHTTLRLTARTILNEPELALAAIRGLLASRPAVA